MRVRQFLLVAILSLPASAAHAETIDVSDFQGGLLSTYQTQWSTLAARGVKVRIVGPCVSACTILVGYIPRNNICVMPNAYLGFHWLLPTSTRKRCRVFIHLIFASGSPSMAASPLKCFGYSPQASTVTFASAERKNPPHPGPRAHFADAPTLRSWRRAGERHERSGRTLVRRLLGFFVGARSKHRRSSRSPVSAPGSAARIARHSARCDTCERPRKAGRQAQPH